MVLYIVENRLKPQLLALLFLAAYSAQLHATNSKVVVESVVSQKHKEQLHFFGVVKSKGIYDIVAPSSGIVSGLSSNISEVKSDRPIMRISPIDPSYIEVNIFTRLEKASLYRKFVENGSFVKAQQVLMQVTVQPYFVVAFSVPPYELKYIKEGRLRGYLFPGTDEEKEVSLSLVYSEAPAANSTFHHFEVRIDCSADLGCPGDDLSGSFAKIVVPKHIEKRITTRDKLTNLN
ncbi:hypothetical protein EDC56_1036 [Sinobacterium caligoides]|uniref:HlyD family secretion protein n=1 Tax=Sinobacterium caligoides TaxID=933926 RepID=A0A3N2E1R4_9GAMM|nr:hypothetical protein [Sinobacterium caligoides]ROS05505.1 hypothetical protein EDC56_1036 [Sinobacterium caligoides]